MEMMHTASGHIMWGIDFRRSARISTVCSVTLLQGGRMLLELLARDAPAAAFEEPVIVARTAGESAETVAELEHSKLLALRVRVALDKSRRREAELSVL